jgi:oxygen-independent coproporphyrinogen III oxidase
MRLSDLVSSVGAEPRAIYIHIPFCYSKCGYCDFHSCPLSASTPSLRALYVEKILSRLRDCLQGRKDPIETLYIGGGTPTALEDGTFERLVSGVGALVGGNLREWTLEANPESLSPRKLEAAARAGVSRLSLGIQSMEARDLELLGRKAGPEDNARAVGLAVASRLAVSADLISALPLPAAMAGVGKGRSKGLGASLDFLLGAGVGHISLYDLVVEEGTPMAARIGAGELVLPDADEAWEERKAAETRLAAGGFGRYEVSNFAPPGAESIHNGVYWSLGSYLGIGSGAVSTLVSESPIFDREDPGTASLRMEEGRDLASWTADPDASLSVSRISRKDSAFETVMMGLRTRKGLDLERFGRRFEADPLAILTRTLVTWKHDFSIGEGRLSVGDAGMDRLNPILVDALVDIEKHFGGSHG